MFANLFFILLVLTLLNFVPNLRPMMWESTPQEGFERGLLLYGLLLVTLYLQARWWPQNNQRLRNSYSFFVQIELFIFLGIYHIGLGAQRLWMLGEWSSFNTPFTLIAMILYLGGLGWAHYWQSIFIFYHSAKQSWRQAANQLLFIIPFCLPFLIFNLVFDIVDQIPTWHHLMQLSSPLLQGTILIGISLALLTIVSGFMPPLLIKYWQCKPILNEDLMRHLEKVCERLHFKHAGIYTWTIMKHHFTAGIIGIFPFARYIMFTPPLLSHFQTEEIEAILVHEIGHNHYKHLLIYPFILMGMLLVGAAGLLFLNQHLSFLVDLIPISEKSAEILLTALVFSFYALLLALYFRLIFGFFSRLFERQADLHIFKHALPPHFMIQALDRIGTVTGHSHNHPNWHHFSLQQRIQFLEAAIANPQLVEQHHGRVKKWLWIYFIVLILGSGALFYFT